MDPSNLFPKLLAGISVHLKSNTWTSAYLIVDDKVRSIYYFFKGHFRKTLYIRLRNVIFDQFDNFVKYSDLIISHYSSLILHSNLPKPPYLLSVSHELCQILQMPHFFIKKTKNKTENVRTSLLRANIEKLPQHC